MYLYRESVKYVYGIVKLRKLRASYCDFWRECPSMVVARRNLETCGAPVCSVCSVCSAAMPPPGSATHTFFARARPSLGCLAGNHKQTLHILHTAPAPQAGKYVDSRYVSR